MAKKTIADIQKAYNESFQERERLEGSISELRDQLTAKRTETEEVATKGNVDAYMACLEDIKQLEARIYIAERQMKSLQRPFTEEDVKAAWDDYATDFNKQMEKRLKEYRTAVETMEKAYIDLVNFQNEALKTRKLCGEMMGVECPDYTTQNNDIYYRMLKKLVTIPNEPIMKTIDTGTGIIKIKMPDDAEYFLAHKLISPEMIGCVVRMHKPVF